MLPTPPPFLGSGSQFRLHSEQKRLGATLRIGWSLRGELDEEDYLANVNGVFRHMVGAI